MTGKIINLRTVRRQKQRAEAATNADTNRVKFGRTGVQKKADKVSSFKAKKHLDGHKLGGKTGDD